MISKIAKILNHKRAEIGWVVRADIGADGKPCIVRMARVVCIWPVDGAGRLTVAISDWGHDGQGEAKHYTATANGYGYDKFTAATEGMSIGGIPLGNHCDRNGRGTFRAVVNDNGWDTFNIPGGW
jgi:hypothetical protein